MLKVLGVLILCIAAFVGGMYYERLASGKAGALTSEIARLETENQDLEVRIQELKDTLNLVKRQIQTDRIAYQALQESVGSSDSERDELKQQLEDQRQLLKSLREKLEALENQ